MYNLLEIVNKNKFRNEDWMFKNYPDLHFFVSNSFMHLNISWKEKIYLNINDLDSIPLCYCGGVLRFINSIKGYVKYCSLKCAANCPISISNRKRTNLEKYGFEFHTQSEVIKENNKLSLLEKYGVDNISKLESIKEKKKESILEKYGCEYNSQRYDVRINLKNNINKNRDLINDVNQERLFLYISNKILSFGLNLISVKSSNYLVKCLEGHEFKIHKDMLNDRIRNRNTICTLCNPINSSSDSELQVLNFIKENYGGVVISNDRKLIGKELDIYLPDLGLAFEYNGLFWHSDLYKDKNYHLNKTNSCENINIKLIQIWEDDWIFRNDIVKSRILHLLGRSKKIYARKCEIELVSNRDSKEFMISNNLYGYIKSDISVGLYCDNNLVCLVTFNGCEITTFCSSLGFVVIGGFSKLLNYIKKKYNPVFLIIDVDRCWSNGNLYKDFGFTFKEYREPNCYVVIKNRRYLDINSYSMKIYDSGYLKFNLLN